nr:immunoglobulin heavy chain junction region [Homo sapiens]
YLQMNSLRAE